jgi:hypothetical protein
LSRSFVLWMEKPMASDERDRNFDKALSRHLRSAAAPAPPTSVPGALGSQTPSCLDPEMLAAYHERSLVPEEMNSAKEHIVGCAHCQAILAQLELTDAIPLALSGKGEVPAMAAAARAPITESVQLAAQPALPEKPRAPRLIRGPRWQWLVPAGALAAGLLVWIGMHENQPLRTPASNEVKVAKLEEPVAPPPALNKQASSSPSPRSSDELVALPQSRGGAGGVASGTLSRDGESLKRLQEAASGRKAPPVISAPSREGKENEEDLRKDTGAESRAVQVPAEKQADFDAKVAASGGLLDKAQVQNQAANIQAQNQMIAPKVPGPAPLGQVEQSKKLKSDSGARYRAEAPPPAPAQPQSAPVAGYAASALEVVAIANPHLISAPGTSFVWRAGRSGLIEFSSDNGASWSRQTSGVLVDLTAGSAPSAKICWMVGRVGAIVLTTDGGTHWAIIHSPLDEDLGGIRAVDALHATIWNLRKTKSFETADGGATWKPVPAP